MQHLHEQTREFLRERFPVTMAVIQELEATDDEQLQQDFFLDRGAASAYEIGRNISRGLDIMKRDGTAYDEVNAALEFSSWGCLLIALTALRNSDREDIDAYRPPLATALKQYIREVHSIIDKSDQMIRDFHGGE